MSTYLCIDWLNRVHKFHIGTCFSTTLQLVHIFRQYNHCLSRREQLHRMDLLVRKLHLCILNPRNNYREAQYIFHFRKSGQGSKE